MTELLDHVYFDNSVRDYLIAAGIIVAGLLFVRIFRRIMLNRLKKWSEKTDTPLDDFLVAGIERFGLPLLNLLTIYIGLNYLTLPEKGVKALEVATTVVVTYFGIRLVSRVIKLAMEGYIRKQEGGEEKIKQVKGILVVINITIWTVGVLLVFSNLGYNVTAIITGLGIGGIAIALAAQNILGDLFNYFVIFFDRPFEVGDFIVVDTKMGTVEHVGIKTTRVKSLSGEQLVFSNSDLTNSRIHNFKRMQRRRVVFTLGVVYNTQTEKIKLIPGMIRDIVESHEKVTFDRAHFARYGDFSLIYEVVYYVESSEYNDYMDIHQDININIFEEFKKQGIEFAYPTQTVLLNKMI
jgi:small-conductance mechanosensitive channel